MCNRLEQLSLFIHTPRPQLQLYTPSRRPQCGLHSSLAELGAELKRTQQTVPEGWLGLGLLSGRLWGNSQPFWTVIGFPFMSSWLNIGAPSARLEGGAEQEVVYTHLHHVVRYTGTLLGTLTRSSFNEKSPFSFLISYFLSTLLSTAACMYSPYTPLHYHIALLHRSLYMFVLSLSFYTADPLWIRGKLEPITAETHAGQDTPPSQG